MGGGMFKRNQNELNDERELKKTPTDYFYDSRTAIQGGGMNLKSDSFSAKVLSGTS